MIINENSLRVEVPDGRWFRLKRCDAFESIRGDTLHDVDIIWQNEGDSRLWLVELKDYGELIDRDPNHGYLVSNLKEKYRDTLYVLASVWAGSAFGNQLRKEIQRTFYNFPEEICPIRPVVILNLEARFQAMYGELKTALNASQGLMSTLSVMDVSHIMVCPPHHPFVRDKLQITIETDVT